MERELDIIESNCIKYDNLGVEQICYIYFISSKNEITKKQLEAAMTILVNRHPLLRMRVFSVNGKYHWKAMENTQVNVRVDKSKDWQLAFSKALEERFETENGPLWSLTLLPNVTSEFFEDDFTWCHAALMFRFSHAIADGMSMLWHFHFGIL